MIDIDIDEAIEVITIGSTKQKAAKPYYCAGGCGRGIVIGKEYVRVAMKIDGQMYTDRFHPGCENAPPEGYCGCMGGNW